MRINPVALRATVNWNKGEDPFLFQIADGRLTRNRELKPHFTRFCYNPPVGRLTRDRELKHMIPLN